MIQGYGSTQNYFNRITEAHPLMLVGPDHRVELEVVEKLKGQVSLTQWILKPKELLKTGRTYVLRFDHPNQGYRNDFRIYDYDLSLYRPPHWTVSGKPDTDVPEWEREPYFARSSFRKFGCGNKMLAHFYMHVKDASELLFKVEVMDESTGKSGIYYLTEEDQVVKIGRGMCSGAFDFQEERKYKARFQLMDACGNQEPDFTDWVSF